MGTLVTLGLALIAVSLGVLASEDTAFHDILR
jgi:hypothetical protein